MDLSVGNKGGKRGREGAECGRRWLREIRGGNGSEMRGGRGQEK